MEVSPWLAKGTIVPFRPELCDPEVFGRLSGMLAAEDGGRLCTPSPTSFTGWRLGGCEGDTGGWRSAGDDDKCIEGDVDIEVPYEPALAVRSSILPGTLTGLEGVRVSRRGLIGLVEDGDHHSSENWRTTALPDVFVVRVGGEGRDPEPDDCTAPLSPDILSKDMALNSRPRSIGPVSWGRLVAAAAKVCWENNTMHQGNCITRRTL